MKGYEEERGGGSEVNARKPIFGFETLAARETYKLIEAGGGGLIEWFWATKDHETVF